MSGKSDPPKISEPDICKEVILCQRYTESNEKKSNQLQSPLISSDVNMKYREKQMNNNKETKV